MYLVLVALVAAPASQVGDTLAIILPAERTVAPAVALEAVLSLGSVDGPEMEAFGAVADVALLDGGYIAVADRYAREVRLFSEAGAFVRRIGRAGEGPGEFQSIDGIAPLDSGRFSVWDPSQGRMTVFDTAGVVLDEFRVELGTILVGSEAGMIRDRRGRYWVRTAMRYRGPTEPLWPGWLRISSSGTVIDSVFPPRRHPSASNWVYPTTEEGRTPFVTLTMSAPSPDGFLVSARNDRYAISWPLDDGRVVLLSRTYEPRRPSTAERLEWQRFSDHAAVRFGVSSTEVPPVKPAMRALRVDDDGRIWVARFCRAYEDPAPLSVLGGGDAPRIGWVEPNVYDVVDPRGRLLWTVVFPRDMTFVRARGDRAVGVRSGQFDEKYVEVFALPGHDQLSRLSGAAGPEDEPPAC